MINNKLITPSKKINTNCNANSICDDTVNNNSISAIENTIISLVSQQALLKLTNHTAHHTMLAYCLERTEQLLNVKFIMLDHKHVQSNLRLPSIIAQQISNLMAVHDNTLLNKTYFQCSLDQFNQQYVLNKCLLAEDDLSKNDLNGLKIDNTGTSKLNLDAKLDSNLDLNLKPNSSMTPPTTTPLNRLPQSMTIVTVINTLITKGWLVRQTSHQPAHQDMVAYRLNFIQLQHDLKTIGYELMVVKNNSVKTSDSDDDIYTDCDNNININLHNAAIDTANNTVSVQTESTAESSFQFQSPNNSDHIDHNEIDHNDVSRDDLDRNIEGDDAL